MVAWDADTYLGSPNGIFGRRYDRAGAPEGTSFQINTYTTGYRGVPSVAVSPTGGFVVIWASYEQDGSKYGVFARRSNVAPVSMQVDTHALLGASAAFNGVLEAGETVVVEPSWKILTVGGGPFPIAVPLSGTASNFSGPVSGFGLYDLDDSEADYGLINPGDAGNCYDDTIAHDCYLVRVTSANHAGLTHWDANLDETVSSGGLKTWKVHVG